MLIGGDPGIGKSTLLLQVAAAARAPAARRVVYISGEEAVDQIRLRADRLGLRDAPVQLAAATNVRDILASLDGATPPDIVVIDSIQTMFATRSIPRPGTVTPGARLAAELIRLAKRRGFTCCWSAT